MDDEEIIAIVLIFYCIIIKHIIRCRQLVAMAANSIRLSTLCFIIQIIKYYHNICYLTYRCFFHLRFRQNIIKVDYFFEQTVPNMTPRMFRRYFRMYSDTMENLINYLWPLQPLQQPHQYQRIPVEKKIAMTCAYLGSTCPVKQSVLKL